MILEAIHWICTAIVALYALLIAYQAASICWVIREVDRELKR